jgi:hypothetical protein
VGSRWGERLTGNSCDYFAERFPAVFGEMAVFTQ